MDEYKSRLSAYLTDLIREELEKYEGGYTDEWNDQRKKNAEVLGYKLAGTSDINEGSFKSTMYPKKGRNDKIRFQNDPRRLYKLKKITHGNRGIPEDPAGTSYMFVAPGNRKEYFTKKSWRLAMEKGWLSLETINEEITDWQGKYDYGFKFKKGQLIRDINPDCPHHGSEGEVTKVTKDEVTYTVRNNGKTYKVGDELTKTKDQLTPLSLDESINEKMGPEEYHKYLQYVFDTQFKTPEEKKMKKSIIKKINKSQKKKGLSLFKELVNERRGISIGEEGMRFFTDQLINAMEDVDEREFVRHMSKELRVDKKVMKRVWKNYLRISPQNRYKWWPRNWERWLKKQGITETSERDYKAEYKKFQSSTKSKKYRAELNQYNRKKGTYGNNDGKDASHKGGKIAGFEKESTNRGRREKSRLKKEGINEVRWPDTQTARLLSQAFKDARVRVSKVWEKGNHKYILRVRATDGNVNVKMELNVVSNVIMMDTQSGHVRLGELQPGSRGRKLTKNLKMLSKLPSFGVAGFKGLKYKIESILKEDIGVDVYLGGIVKALSRAGIKPKTAKQMKHGFSKSKDKIGFFIDVLDRKREKYTLQLEVDRDGNLWYLSAPRPMKLGKWADTSKIVRSLKAISKLPDFGQSSLNRR